MCEQQEALELSGQQLRDMADVGYLNEMHRNVFRNYILGILNGAVWRDGLAAVHAWKPRQWNQVRSIAEHAVQLEIAMGRQHNYTLILRPTVKKEEDGEV